MKVSYYHAGGVQAPVANLEPQRGGRRGNPVSRLIYALVKYATNHIINRIPSYTIRHGWYRHVLGWQIGPRAAIMMGQQIDFGKLRGRGKTVIIGAGVIVNRGCFLQTFGGLVIGEDTSISTGVSIVTGSHDINDPEFILVREPIVIGHHVWIGINATILAGVTIEPGAVVAAGAVVRSNVPPNAIVGGIPAKVVGRRRLEHPMYELNYRPLFE